MNIYAELISIEPKISQITLEGILGQLKQGDICGAESNIQKIKENMGNEHL